MKPIFLFLVFSFIFISCNPTKNPPKTKTSSPETSTNKGAGKSSQLEEPSSGTIDQNAGKTSTDSRSEVPSDRYEDENSQRGSGSTPEVFEEDYEEEYIEEEPQDINKQRMEKNGSSVNEEEGNY